MDQATVRQKAVQEIARHFYHHLLAEQKKAPELIDSIRFDHKSARVINAGLIDRIGAEFPAAVVGPPPDYNFIVKWVQLNQFHLRYEDFAFEAYNLIFMERLISLKRWSDEGHGDFKRTTIEVFDKFDTEQDGFSVSFFIRAENNMRELLREIVDGIPEFGDADRAAAWELIFQQSKEYQEVVNEFFEQVLNQALRKSEDLLHNILPVKISDELKQNGRVSPVQIAQATVLFTDFKGFTMLSEKMSPERLIAELDECFSAFDQIIDRHNLEKIKTIGDSYMCAGGLPEPNRTHVLDAALAALEMREAIANLKARYAAQSQTYWDVRIGFHTGPLVAGVIGRKKFSYDIWGDTVNTASRMESSGAPGRVNVSEASRQQLKYFFECEPRGRVAAKNKGDMEMAFLNRLKPAFSADADGLKPNEAFYAAYKRIQAGARVAFRSEI